MNDPTNENCKLYTPEEIEKLNKDRSFSSYSSQNDGTGSIISAVVRIEGREIFTRGGHFKIKLNQRTLETSTFEIRCREDEFDSSSEFPLTHSKHTIGSRLSIAFKQFGKTTFSFTGLITGLKREKQGQDGHLVISGCSPDILLQGGQVCRSFENQTLEEIVREVCQGLPLDVFSLQTKPKYRERIPYLVQYKESNREYIQRLAKRYGEWLYWKGESWVFGGFGGKTVELLDSEDMEGFRMHMEVRPQYFSYLSYQAEQGETLDSGTDGFQKQNITNHFQEHVLETSKKMYPQQPENYYNSSLLETGSKELSEIVSRQSQHRQSVLFIEGKTYNPNLNIGDILKLHEWTPESRVFKNKISPLESYLITEIEHQYTEAGGYYNRVKAVPGEQWIPPYYDEQAYPQAEKQRAVVTDNNDLKGLGRVRVRFDWMKPGQQSPWIRMLQPHAGAGKGFNWKPETGEEVLVDFEGNSMEKPYVAGCLYNGKQKSGYDTRGNNLKVIKTRSGHTLILDDTEGGLHISLADSAGNLLYFDTMEKGISLSAPEYIKILTKRLEIQAEEDIHIQAGNEIVQISTGNTRIHSGKDIEVEANHNLDLFGKKKIIQYTPGNAEIGAGKRMHVHGASSQFTALTQIQYKAPDMNMLPESGIFKYGKDKQVLKAKWVEDDMRNEKVEFKTGEKLSLWVQTRNYEAGESIRLKIREKDNKEINNGVKEVILEGIVEQGGTALLREQVEIGEEQKPEQARKEEIQDKTKEVYKTFKGREYTQKEWRDFENKEWEYYQYRKKNKGLFGF